MFFTQLGRICSAFVILIFMGGSSCNDPSRNVVNAWRMAQFKPGIDFSESPEHQRVFREFEQKARLEFNQDGTYRFDLVSSVQEGTWQLDKKNMLLITTSRDGIVTKSKIRELKPDKMVLEQEGEGYTNLLILVPKEE
ncbi:MAG: hypothetical protein KatS3mg031_0310 [Chitinophagales bacterium]|nr:MAG: hypothetical protein KatS3mg031_0310 [Chitinophagales bacterium]